MSAIVCDSCVMQRYIEALIAGQVDCAIDVINCIRENHKFAMDMGRKMEHQWIETCGHQIFGEILVTWLREGRIEIFPGKLHEQHRKYLQTKCGFPFSQRHEGVFVSVAAEAFPHILVGDDLDFWEPAEKGCPGERRRKLMGNGKGSVCVYLKRELDVQVTWVEQAINLLCPDTGE